VRALWRASPRPAWPGRLPRPWSPQRRHSRSVPGRSGAGYATGRPAQRPHGRGDRAATTSTPTRAGRATRPPPGGSAGPRRRTCPDCAASRQRSPVPSPPEIGPWCTTASPGAPPPDVPALGPGGAECAVGVRSQAARYSRSSFPGQPRSRVRFVWSHPWDHGRGTGRWRGRSSSARGAVARLSSVGVRRPSLQSP
jgi:hypothetical protein